MKFLAEMGFQVGLKPIVLVPCNSFKKGINKSHQHEGGDELWVKARSLSDTARYDRWNGRCEGQQEKELHQFVAVF